MHDSSPSPAPAAPAAPTKAHGAALASGAGRFAQRALDGALNWPGGRWPVPTVTSLFAIALLIVAAVEWLPNGWSDVTLTVNARTEVVELDLDPQRRYVWWLPAGAYSLLEADGNTGCEVRHRFDVACSYTDATALTITNGGTVRIEVTEPRAATGARFSIAVTPRRTGGDGSSPPASAFEIRNASDEPLVATGQLVTFESALVDGWRIPLILKRVQIGEFLSESIATGDAMGMTRQPIMTEGDVRIFARSLGSDERYQVQEERFDPADIVQIPAEAGTDGLLLGLLVLDIDDGEAAFDLTLHTDLAEVFVRRLGAEHRIGVSMWSIVSRLPMWLALWVVWVSLIVVANYYSDRLGEIRGHRHDTQQQ